MNVFVSEKGKNIILDPQTHNFPQQKNYLLIFVNSFFAAQVPVHYTVAMCPTYLWNVLG